jgi:hypothetical protein
MEKKRRMKQLSVFRIKETELGYIPKNWEGYVLYLEIKVFLKQL